MRLSFSFILRSSSFVKYTFLILSIPVNQFLTYKQEILDEKMPTIIKYKMDLDLFYGLITKELVDKTHARGAKINAWTPGNIKEGERLASIGVDDITSNFLE